MHETATGALNVVAILPTWDDQTALERIFWHSKWNLQQAEVLGRARLLIEESTAGLVICDQCLPDGNWRDVLHELRRRPLEPLLIVASRLADDRLWAEVLNLGGFDVLATPFHTDEVLRAVRLASRTWRDKLNVGDVRSGVAKPSRTARPD